MTITLSAIVSRATKNALKSKKIKAFLHKQQQYKKSSKEIFLLRQK
jgi:hypothetical protein